MNNSTYKSGQSVVVKYSQVGRMTIIIPATFVRHIGMGLMRCVDHQGTEFDIGEDCIFHSQEELEASISALRVAVDAGTGNITEFPR